MRLMKQSGLTFVLIGLAAGLACGKKSSNKGAEGAPNDVNGTVTAATGTLTLSSTLDILPAKLTEDTALRLTEFDDQKAKIKYYLREDSMETISMASGVICLIGQTQYVEQANSGPYGVLLDEELCFDDGDDSGDESTTDTGVVNYVRGTVDVIREDGKALEGKMWLDMSDEGEENLITINFKVAEGASDSNPLGIFRLVFNSSAGGGGFVETFRDELGRVNLHVLDTGDRESDSWANIGAARLEIANGEVTSGFFKATSNNAYTHGGQENSSEGAYKVGFNSGFIHRYGKTKDSHNGNSSEEESTVCLNRDEYNKAAHRYNLYDANGALVKLNSGFPIIYTGKDGKPAQGHAGYHGIWTQNNSLAGVTDVKRIDYVDGETVETPYKVVTAPGKLIEYTRAQTTLGAIKDVELETHTNNGRLIVSWNGTKFVKVATVTFGEGPEQRTPASGNYTLSEMDWGYNFFVPSLQAQIFINKDATLSDSFKISYHNERVVSGTADAPTGNLYCFNDCPKMAPTASEMSSGMGGGGPGSQTSGPYKTTVVFDMTSTASANIEEASILSTFTWDKASHNLKEGSTAFKLPSFSKDQMAHLRSGVLIPQATWQALSNKANTMPYELDQKIEKFYRFQSGSDSWSQYQALVDANNKLVKFDAPISISYVHTIENDLNGKDDNPHYGKPARLDYGGPGQLWGFPSEMSPRGWYVPQYGLKAGATLGDYTVLPIEIEQVLEEAADGSCESLALDDLPELPGTEVPTVDIGEEPAADTILVKYIAGEATGAE